MFLEFNSSSLSTDSGLVPEEGLLQTPHIDMQSTIEMDNVELTRAGESSKNDNGNN